MPTTRIKLPGPPPTAHSTDMDYWLESLVTSLQSFQITVDPFTPQPSSMAWPGFLGAPYTLESNPFSNSGPNGWIAWCLETNPYSMLIGMGSADDKVMCVTRIFDRWKPVPASSGTTFAGPKFITITNPGPIIFVPTTGASGTGAARGKFWVFSSTTDTITLVTPGTWATSTVSMGAGYANVTRAYYCPTLDAVYIICGNKTIITQLDPTDGSNIADNTGWTTANDIGLLGTKLWVTRDTAGGNDNVFYIDTTSFATAATNISYATLNPGFKNITICAALDRVGLIEGYGGNKIHFLNATSNAYEAQLDIGINHYEWGSCYIPDLQVLVWGGVTYIGAFDVVTGCFMYYINTDRLPHSPSGLSWSYYIPETKDVFITHANGWICCPTPIDTTVVTA